MPINHFATGDCWQKFSRSERGRTRRVATLIVVASICAASSQCLAEDDAEAPKGAAVTVLKATKSCFSAVVEVSGILIPKDEIAVRPDRPGLKVAEVLVDAGETVTAGQPLARLGLPEGGTIPIQAPTAGLVSGSSAVTGTIASGKGEALYSIIARSEFDLVGLVPTKDISKLAVDQTAKIKIVGAGEMAGKVRRVSATIEPNSQLGQVFVSVTSTKRLLVNSAGRALIKTGESCGVAVPLTAVLYGTAGTVVQVVRRQRVETRHVEIGLMSAGQVEIRDGVSEGDIVVARAGALLREGDPVRPVTADAEAK
jgi:HlyD family secretion protein